MQNLLELCGITIDDLIELYNKEKSVKRVAIKLGVSRPTATKWLKIAKVQTLGHRPIMKPTASMQGEYSVVTKWLQLHRGMKLPASIDEAAAIVGCSKDALRCYLFRRKKRILRYLDSFGDLRSYQFVLTTTSDRHIKVCYIDEYKYVFDPRTYELLININVKGANFQVKTTLKKMLTLLKGEDIVQMS